METERWPGSPRELALRFFGSGSEYFRIWIVNLLLTIVTLSLYHPFAKARRLRYFHSNTLVGGHALGFHGDPWKMLRGYLLVLLLLGVYSLAGQISPMADTVAFVIVAAIWPALWHSSLRFRLANTGWRGLRFAFTGTRSAAYQALAPALALSASFVAYGAWFGRTEPTPPPQAPVGLMLLAALAPLLLVLVLMPALFWLMRLYQHGHYALGAERTRFGVRPGAFYGVGLRALGMLVLAGFVAGVTAALVAVPLGRRAMTARDAIPIVATVFFVVLAVAQVVIWPYITARMQNLVWNGTCSQHLLFRSRLEVRPLLWLTLKNWLLIVLTLGLYFPFAQVATARLRVQAVTVLSDIAPEALVVGAKARDESAAGDAAGDLFGVEIGL